MRRNATLLLLLCSLFLLGTAGKASAQVNITYKVDPSAPGGCCWSFTVQNNSQQAITSIVMNFTNLGNILFATSAGPGTWGEAEFSEDFKQITFKNPGGSPIQPGQSLGGFYFCHDGLGINDLDKPVRVSWATFNAQTPITNGTNEFTCTSFQTLNRYDTVNVTAQRSGTDPVYTFTVKNRNQPSSAEISRMVFEVLNTTAGTPRPSLTSAPTGWTLDSVTATRVYFSTLQSAIGVNQDLSGFKVGLRSSANADFVSWVWRAQTADGTLIDRDTLRNVPNDADNGAPSNDVVAITKQAGCLYNMSVSNFHALNLQPPSKITEVRIVSKLSGVTFTSAPTRPAGWGASIKAGTKDTIFFKASGDNTALPSGLTFSDFAFAVDNPAGSTFNIEWQTLRNGIIISSGSELLECVVEAPKGDLAAFAPIEGENCFYRVTITNQHNTPASNLGAIGLSIPANSGTITAIGSSLSWTPQTTNNTSFLFRLPEGSTETQATGATQEITFRLTPKDPSTPVVVTWNTYETPGGPSISTGTQSLQCEPTVEQICDSIWVTVANADSCEHTISVLNQRINNEVMNSVTITPADGWRVDSAFLKTGWQRTVGANGSSVTYTGSAPGGLAVPQNFVVRFNAAVGTPNAFTATVTTLGENNTLTCTKPFELTCTPRGIEESVEPRLQSMMRMSLAPNPANLQTSVSYYLPEQTRAVITVIDMLGNTQSSVFTGMLGEGNHDAKIDASNLANGSYYVRIETSYGTITKQLVINR